MDEQNSNFLSCRGTLGAPSRNLSSHTLKGGIMSVGSVLISTTLLKLLIRLNLLPLPNQIRVFPGGNDINNFLFFAQFKILQLSIASEVDSSMGTKGNIKCCAAIFHFLIFIAGVSSLSMGVYIIASDYGAHQLSTVLGDELYHIAAYIAIAGGAAIAMVSLCGVCGSLKENKCILFIYSILMGIILAVFLVTTILLFVFLGQMSVKIEESMKTALIKKYGHSLDKSENRMVTEVWDLMQKNLECCGVSGDINSTDSWAIYKRESTWFKNGNNMKAYVPDSCCKPGGNLVVCTGLNGTAITPVVGPPVFNEENPYLYHKGCYDELVHYVQGHVLMIGGIAIASVVVIMFGLISSVSLYRSIREVDSY